MRLQAWGFKFFCGVRPAELIFQSVCNYLWGYMA